MELHLKQIFMKYFIDFFYIMSMNKIVIYKAIKIENLENI